MDAGATRRRPKGEGQDAPSQRARLESECTLIPYRGFDQSAQPIRTHDVRPEGVRSEATNQSRPLNDILDMERWLSGLRRSLGKRVYAYTVPRVRIPPSPPVTKKAPFRGFLLLPEDTWSSKPWVRQNATVFWTHDNSAGLPNWTFERSENARRARCRMHLVNCAPKG